MVNYVVGTGINLATYQNQQFKTKRKSGWNIRISVMKVPPGEPLLIHVTPSTIDDSSQSEKEIYMALKKMKRNKSPGASGIHAEHLLDWMNGANSGDPTKIEAWNKVLELVELVFTGKPLSKSFGMGILVLIPKGVPDKYRGIAYWK